MGDLAHRLTLLWWGRERPHLPYNPPTRLPLVLLAAALVLAVMTAGHRDAAGRGHRPGYRPPSGLERLDPSVDNPAPVVPDAVRPLSGTTLAVAVPLLSCERLATARAVERPDRVVVAVTAGTVRRLSCDGRPRTARVLLHLRRPLGSRPVVVDAG